MTNKKVVIISVLHILIVSVHEKAKKLHTVFFDVQIKKC